MSSVFEKVHENGDRFVTDTAEDILSSKIVIIDDEPSSIDMLTYMLGDADYANIESFNDPAQGLDYCLSNPVDLILLDLVMPDMDGLEVLKKLDSKIHDEFLPVIVLSAHASEDARDQSLEAGAHDFLSKPFQQGEVLLRIKNNLTTRMYYKLAMRPIK